MRKGGCMDHTNPLELISRDPVEFSLLSLKSKLVIIITRIIADKNLNQKEAAELLGVSQPRVSNLITGRINKFSIDTLLEMLGKLGYLMDLSFDPDNTKNPICITVNKTVI